MSATVIALPPVDRRLRAVGERLRQLRLAPGLGEARLSAEMRIDREVLLRAERGRVRLTAGQHYAVTLALRPPMRLLFEPGLDVCALRPL